LYSKNNKTAVPRMEPGFNFGALYV
jgi:hypothetical protein